MHRVLRKKTKRFSLYSLRNVIPSPFKTNNLRQAQAEIRNRKEKYPQLIHHVKRANHYLIIQSSRVDDYIQDILNKINEKYSYTTNE